MSALSFLNKKSWHTRTLKNNERVWDAEQRDAQEAKRIAELRKQLEHERHIEDLQQFEAEAGGASRNPAVAPPKSRTQLEWMYEVGKSESAQQAEREDLLLGKRAAALPAHKHVRPQFSVAAFDPAASGVSLGADAAGSYSGSLFDPLAGVVDAAAKSREDPMAIMRAEEDPLVMTNDTLGAMPRASESISEFDACNSGLAEDNAEAFPQPSSSVPRKRKHNSMSSRRAVHGDVRRSRKSADLPSRRSRPNEYSSDSSSDTESVRDAAVIRDNVSFSSSSSSEDSSDIRDRKRYQRKRSSSGKNRSKKSSSSSSGNRRSSRRREKRSRACR